MEELVSAGGIMTEAGVIHRSSSVGSEAQPYSWNIQYCVLLPQIYPGLTKNVPIFSPDCLARTYLRQEYMYRPILLQPLPLWKIPRYSGTDEQ